MGASTFLPTGLLVQRVRERLDELGDFGHLRVRGYGQHVLIEPSANPHIRDRDAIARLTPLGRDAYGLSFRKRGGGWEPIALIDTLDDIVVDMTIAIEVEPGSAMANDAA